MRYDQKTTDPFYKSGAWKRLRKAALERDHYWCQRCRRKPAEIVHHVIPREERPDLSLTLENLESVCAMCHAQLHPEKGAKTFRGQRPETPTGIRIIEIK